MSELIRVDNRFNKVLRIFLRRVVANLSAKGAVLIFPGKFSGIGRRCRMWSSVVTALDGDGRHRYIRQRGELLFIGVIFLLPLLQPQTPAVITERDGNVVRIIEGFGAGIEGGIAECPVRRSLGPDQTGKIVRIFSIAFSTARRGEVELIPPL